MCSVNMHVLLEVLRTLQAAGFQYFVDLEDLINIFFLPKQNYYLWCLYFACIASPGLLITFRKRTASRLAQLHMAPSGVVSPWLREHVAPHACRHDATAPRPRSTRAPQAEPGSQPLDDSSSVTWPQHQRDTSRADAEAGEHAVPDLRSSRQEVYLGMLMVVALMPFHGITHELAFNNHLSL